LIKLQKPVLSIAGRLDKFVSGLVLLSQDGNLIEQIISPFGNNALGKVYEVSTYLPFNGKEPQIFGSGQVMLRSEETPLKPAKFEIVNAGEHMARVTLYEGRYHQLTRMFASIGNKPKSIHRVQIGPLNLGNLASGQWRFLTEDEYKSIMNPSPLTINHKRAR